MTPLHRSTRAGCRPHPAAGTGTSTTRPHTTTAWPEPTFTARASSPRCSSPSPLTNSSRSPRQSTPCPRRPSALPSLLDPPPTPLEPIARAAPTHCPLSLKPIILAARTHRPQPLELVHPPPDRKRRRPGPTQLSPLKPAAPRCSNPLPLTTRTRCPVARFTARRSSALPSTPEPITPIARANHPHGLSPLPPSLKPMPPLLKQLNPRHASQAVLVRQN